MKRKRIVSTIAVKTISFINAEKIDLSRYYRNENTHFVNEIKDIVSVRQSAEIKRMFNTMNKRNLLSDFALARA